MNLSFQEERLRMNWNGNLDSSIGKSVRLVIWRSEVRIPVQVQIFLLNSKIQNLAWKSGILASTGKRDTADENWMDRKLWNLTLSLSWGYLLIHRKTQIKQIKYLCVILDTLYRKWALVRNTIGMCLISHHCRSNFNTHKTC